MSEQDWTQGEGLPEEALSAENFVIGGTGATNHDADTIESENSFSDLEPGDYLLKVSGFGKFEKKLHPTFINGQPVNYEAYQVVVRFADASNPRATITNLFRLPPENVDDLNAYNNGTNNKGTGGSSFLAKIFVHFLDKLFPGEAWVSDGNGGKVMSPKAKTLANWKGRPIWAQVEAKEQEKDASGEPKINPTTGEPYPPRNQIKLFSFRPSVEGGPSPFPQKAAKPPAAGQRTTRANPTAVAAPVGVGMGAPNGFADAGLDDI